MLPILPAMALHAEQPPGLVLPRQPSIIMPTDSEREQFDPLLLGILPFPSPLLTVGSGSAYVETGEFGNHGGVSTQYDLGTNFKNIIAVTVPSGGRWVKTLHLKVISATAGDKVLPLLYSGIISSSTLTKQGVEYVFPGTLTTGTYEITTNWTADGSPYFIPAGSYGLGLHSKLTGATLLLAADNAATIWNADTYADGPTSPFGTVNTSASTRMCVWCPSSVTGP